MRVISEFLRRNSEHRPTIHVVGDAMVDEYYNVKVTRISPESPNVCVMLSPTDDPAESLPGGAANVCYQLKNFNVNTELFSFMDKKAQAIFEKAGVTCECAFGDEVKIPRKKRFFDGDVQVSDRWDIEVPNCGLTHLDAYQDAIHLAWSTQKRPDLVILSDYNKGVFNTDQVPFACDRGMCCTIVDPKKGPLSKWRGCTIFKPNSVEAVELSGGLTDWRKQCDFFKSELQCDAVVITQQGDGVVGKACSEYFEYRPQQRVVASKISGAGDCFIGIFALAFCHNMTVEEAAIVAFEAGASFVQHQARTPITPWQLQKKSKFVVPRDLRVRDYKLVFTNGCFDILHSGHLESLRFAKAKGDKLVVAVNSDASVSRLKGPKRPVVPLAERMEMLAALECVDYVVSFEEDAPNDLVAEIMPDVLIKGADWKDKTVAGTEYVKEIHFVPLIEDKSTTNIIEKIKTLM